MGTNTTVPPTKQPQMKVIACLFFLSPFTRTLRSSMYPDDTGILKFGTTPSSA